MYAEEIPLIYRPYATYLGEQLTQKQDMTRSLDSVSDEESNCCPYISGSLRVLDDEGTGEIAPTMSRAAILCQFKIFRSEMLSKGIFAYKIRALATARWV